MVWFNLISEASERSRRSTWAKEYADPWMLLMNALGVAGYQIVSMFLVAYQVLWRPIDTFFDAERSDDQKKTANLTC